jgi:PAS domain S-box-containing protein
MLRSYSISIWRSYQSYVEGAIQFSSNHSVREIEYWQEKLFTTGVLYALPLTLLMLIPCVYLELGSLNSMFIPSFEIITAAAFTFLVLAPGLSLKLRKLLVVLLVALISIALFIFFREFSMGCIYLFSLSALVALIYSNKIAFITVAFNFLVLVCFALAIRYDVFNLHEVINVTFDRWVIYSLNFILMNLVVVALIRQLLNGLARTMRKESWLFNKLQKEVEQTAHLNRHLQTSEEDYKTLFFQSPSPKLIFDIDTLKFLQVNIAATHVYGYNDEEFLEMKLTDIHPEDSADITNRITNDDTTGPLLPYITVHLGKDGKQIHTEVRRSNITYKGKRARMIITTDITQRLKFTEDIQEQNNKLKEIAYIQSHVIRLPLARIMSISELINLEYEGHVDSDLLGYLNVSITELDKVIRDVVKKSEIYHFIIPDKKSFLK